MPTLPHLPAQTSARPAAADAADLPPPSSLAAVQAALPSSPGDVFCKAAARGDLAAVQAALSPDPSLITCTDARGYTPLAWAALNDQAAVVTALLAAGASRTATDPVGQTPLHWSAARGSIAAAEALLAGDGGGVDATTTSTTTTAASTSSSSSLLTTPDAQGYTPLHVAAQHDAAGWLHAAASSWPGGLAGVRAARDSHDRTPLHWAAYKGALAATRLLLVLGADLGATDDEGAAPLHWAALKGHTDVCLALIRAGSAGHRVGGAAVLALRDGTGATPADLARSKGFTSLAGRLDEEAVRAGVSGGRRRRGAAKEDDTAPLTITAGEWRPAARRSWFASAHLAPLTLALALALGWGFEAGVVWAPGAPPPGPGLVAAGALVAALVAGGCVLLVATARADPGRLPIHPAFEEETPDATTPTPAIATLSPPSPSPKAIRETGDGSTDVLSHPAFQNRSDHSTTVLDWTRLCVACRTVRPLRAKHCGTTGLCVARYDHYCPWTGCVIGGGNIGRFVGMLGCYATASAFAFLVAGGRLVRVTSPTPTAPAYGSPTGASMSIALFLLFDGAVALAVTVLACVQARQVSSNLTTAEAVGGPAKHAYLRGPTGRGFVNPFDKGTCLRNWRDAVAGRVGGGGGSARRGRPRGRVGEGAAAAVSGSSPPGRAGRRPVVNRGVEMV